MEADAYCSLQGAALPILSSEDDSLFIHEYLQHQQKQQNSSNYIWLNIKRSTSNRWQWRDGSPLKLNKWILGEPSNKSTGHNCATVTKKGIKTGWKTENCSACQDTVCQKGRHIHISCFLQIQFFIGKLYRSKDKFQSQSPAMHMMIRENVDGLLYLNCLYYHFKVLDQFF